MYINIQVSNMGGFQYHLASALGLLPAQIINIYLGSSLRSMQDVLEDKSTAATGYIVFCFQVYYSVFFSIKILRLFEHTIYFFISFPDFNRHFINGVCCTKGTKGASVSIVGS